MIDAYKIGVTFTVNSQFATDLAKMIADLNTMKAAIGGVNAGLAAGHGSVEKMATTVGRMEGMFGRLKSAAASMAAGLKSAGQATASGFHALGGIHTLESGAEHLWEPAAEARRASLRAALAGAGPAGVKEMQAQAAELARNRGDQTATGYMELQGILYGGIQDAHEVAELAPQFSDFATVMSMNGGALPLNEMVAAFKVIEARNKLYNADHTLNRAGIIRELTSMAAAYNMTEGRQKPSDTYASVQTMGAANASGMSEEGFYGYGTELAQAMKNTKLGTAMTALGRQFDSGVMSKPVLAALVRAKWVNLRDHEGHPLVSSAGGGRFHFADGAIENDALRQANPYAWLIERIRASQAAMKAADPQHRDVSMKQAIAPVFSTGTSSRAAGEAVAISALLEKFSANFEAYVKAHPLSETAARVRAEDPKTNLTTFTNAFTNLMAALGDTAMDQAIGYLQSFTVTMQGWTEYVKTHQKEVGEIIDKAAAFGLIVVGIAGLVGSLALLEASAMLFGVGAVAQMALEALTGERGLKGLAMAIEKIGHAFDSLPPWLVSMVGAGLTPSPLGVPGQILNMTKPLIGAAIAGAPSAAQGAATNADLNSRLRMMPVPGQGAPGTMSPDMQEAAKALGLIPGAPKPSASAPGPSGPLSPNSIDTILNGLGVGPGPKASKSSFVPPAANQNAVHVENIMYLDGDVVHRSVTRRLVRSATLPDADYSGFDGSRIARTAGQPMPI